MKYRINFSLWIIISFLFFGLAACQKDIIGLNMEGENINDTKDYSGSGEDTISKSTYPVYFTATLAEMKQNINTGFAASVSELPADRLITINTYTNNIVDTSLVYLSNSIGTLNPVNIHQMYLTKGSYNVYAVGVNSYRVNPPTFVEDQSSSSLATSNDLQNQHDYIWGAKHNIQIVDAKVTEQLPMEHCCAQVLLKLKSSSNVKVAELSKLAVNASNPSGCKWNLKTGVINPATSLLSTQYDLSTTLTADKVYYGLVTMLPLRLYSDNFLLVDINYKVNDQTSLISRQLKLPVYKYSGENYIGFKGGYCYVYEIELNENDVVLYGVAIRDWISVTVDDAPIIL